MNINTAENGLPALLIEEGNINSDALKNMKLSRAWLMSKLADQNVSDYSKVVIAQVDNSGNLYVDLYGDNMEVTSNSNKN